MKPPSEQQAALEIRRLLAEVMGVAEVETCMRDDVTIGGTDFIARVGDTDVLVEYKSTASTGILSRAIEQLARSAGLGKPHRLPLIVVPFMGEAGRDICERAGVSWLDLSGNAKITGPRLRILIDGRPNKYKNRGRPPNLFAPKSSRISRQLLLRAGEFQTQVELAHATRLDDGYVSKVVRRLVAENLAIQNDGGAVRPRDPALLLDAWRSVYDFERHRILKGHVAARSGDALIRRLADQLAHHDVDYAATGLGAAWLQTHFANFRIASFYLHAMPAKTFLTDIQFSDEEKGANVWFAVPNDEGVFHGAEVIDGIKCVSPVQAYLDLKGHPERAKDAAAELRERHLAWRSNA